VVAVAVPQEQPPRRNTARLQVRRHAAAVERPVLPVQQSAPEAAALAGRRDRQEREVLVRLPGMATVERGVQLGEPASVFPRRRGEPLVVAGRRPEPTGQPPGDAVTVPGQQDPPGRHRVRDVHAEHLSQYVAAPTRIGHQPRGDRERVERLGDQGGDCVHVVRARRPDRNGTHRCADIIVVALAPRPLRRLPAAGFGWARRCAPAGRTSNRCGGRRRDWTRRGQPVAGQRLR
jgi:hypothetical protein